MDDLSKTDISRLNQVSDDEIDYTDIPETDEDFWNDAEVISYSQKKEIHIHIDADIAAWLSKLENQKDQIVNQLLRSYYQTYKKLNSEFFPVSK